MGLDERAQEAGAMPDEQIRIDITAEDEASKVVDEVADKVDELERTPAEIEVTADTDKATRGIEELSDDAKALSRQDAEIVLRARIDDARASLKSLRDDLDQTGDKAGDTQRALDKVSDKPSGPGLRGNAIADLTGPLGEASGAASDFAGVFDGLGDISESVAEKVGLNAAQMSTAIGGIGVAVAGAAALWSYYQGQQQKAKEKQRELVAGQRDLNEALREGNFDEAARSFQKLYGPEAATLAGAFGVSIREVTDFVQGQSTALDTSIESWKEQGGWYETTAGLLEKMRDRYKETNGTIEEQDEVVREVADAFRQAAGDADSSTQAQQRAERQAGRTRDAMDRIRGSLDMQQAFLNFESQMSTAMANTQTEAGNTSQDVLDIKQSILDVAEAADLNPVEVKALLEKVDQGDLAGVKADVDRYYATNKAVIDTQLRAPTQADVDRIKAEIRALVGTLNIDYRPTRITNNGQSYDGPR